MGLDVVDASYLVRLLHMTLGDAGGALSLMIAPEVVGFASDRLAPLYGADSLRRSLIALAFVGGAWHYWRCAKQRRRRARLERVERAPL
jgi:hypothetical protein